MRPWGASFPGASPGSDGFALEVFAAREHRPCTKTPVPTGAHRRPQAPISAHNDTGVIWSRTRIRVGGCIVVDMSSPNPVVDALAFLKQRRAELVAAHEAALAPIDEAINALTDLTTGGSTTPPVVSYTRPSVRTMLLALLNESDQDWSTDEILSAYTSRGTPVHGKNPNLALRAAIADSHKAKEIVRTTRGRYKAARWTAPLTNALDAQVAEEQEVAATTA